MEKKAFRHFSMRAALLLALMLTATTGWGQSSCVLNFISQK